MARHGHAAMSELSPLSGTKRTSMCSERVFPLLTHTGRSGLAYTGIRRYDRANKE